MPRDHRFLGPAPAGATLLEMAIVLAMLGLLASLALPRAGGMLDRARVTAARTEAVTVFAIARHLAIRQSRRATVTIDSRRGRLIVHMGADTAYRRDLARSFGVTLVATQDSMSYHATGIGYGAANLSLRISRGRAADTVVVSRLGRVRH